MATLPEADTRAGYETTLTYDIRVDAHGYAEHLGNVTAILEVADGAGAVTDRGPVAFRSVEGAPEANPRTAVLARDTSGRLWQGESSGHPDKPLEAREQIGYGWDVYDTIL
ncbi:hypothetical protein GCM10010275_32620 [Streptomyces litmocidini]|uniref:hypothetical protein n=1 Tax=Streptomyces litmocidini TaxID=67318 RepID=UPI00167E6A34|nr:hypothetical protein [Streptomyces litmocidini]GGU92875.1 hypothetical protein GCM10010275_32620 [Streptomyces litmocidini]